MVVALNGHRIVSETAPSFLVPRARTVLRWRDGPYAGAQVTVSLTATVGQVFDRLANPRGNEDFEEEATPFEKRLRTFCAWLLVDWNLVRTVLDDDGEPVLDEDGEPQQEPLPVTYESALTLPFTFVSQMLDQTDAEVTGVPGPLSMPSASTLLYPVPSATTEPRSVRRRNSRKRS